MPRHDVVGDVLFRLEYLETLKIICGEKETASNLVNLLGRYIKTIGNVIVSFGPFCAEVRKMRVF